ncbi:putative coiled-coil protein SlyX [Duganella sp. SG902]|uniref:GPO family capsid scaffolding protein n=1 Tax=Duganella sp. SG902 TaxID=2587016 RepID=UPI00159DC51E|nr:GPO family capsid scaffolding protein [Duganella sp. SG902]NVM80083.1 putative coiled-coil protein SlyX [Duganella sp. SG902]
MIRKRHITLTLAAIGLLGLTASAHAATGVHIPMAGAADAASLGLMGLGAFGTVATTGTDNHADKTKMFRIAKEGATTDGRTIERAWLEEMAASYDPVNTYGARINLEHIKGYTPDSPFKAYGDVLALETREEADGKLGLYAQIKPTADLVAMTKAGQKVYTSCEINPKFADTGKAYLVGLAVTDSPASLGTEMLAFTAKNPETMAKRKQAPDNLFSVASEELVLDMEAPGLGTVLLSKVKALLGKAEKESGQADARFADVNAAVVELATHTTESIKQLTATTTEQAKTIKEQGDKLAELTAKLSATSDGTPARRVATGGSGQNKTDC